MYPKNAASPPRIAVGAVVQISDGAVQSSGVSIAVVPQGGASGAGGGTTAYDNGIVLYTPTQAETNYIAFVVTAYKTGCIPVAQTIVTTASAVSGYAGLDWATINAPTTTQGLSGTTIKTATDVETDTADIQTRLPAALVGGRIDANVGAISADSVAADNAEAFFDGTGYAGTNNVIPLVTTTTTATNVTTVNGLAANVITAASMAADASAEIADAVWDEDATGHQTQGTFGQAIGDPAADTNTIYKAVVTDATGATVGVDVVDLKTQIGTAGAGLTAIDLPDQTMNITGNITGNLSGSVGSVTGAVGSVTGAVGSVTGNVGGNVVGSVGSVTGAVGSVTGNVGGNVTGSVGSVAAGGITASSIADAAIDRATFAADTGLQTIRSNTAQAGAAGTITLDASASATDDFYNDTLVYITGGTGVGQIRHISDYVGATKVATIKPSWATTPDATSTFAVIPATSVWDHVTADHLDSGSTGASLNAAGAAGDPWTTALPGAYGAGSAGYIVGTNINATVSSRASQTSVDTIDDFLDTEVAAILADTNELQTDWVNGGRLDLLVDAIKAKTDQLAFSTANRVDAQVFGMENGTVTAAAIATNAIDADAIAADAVTEIQNGLATPTNITAGTITTVTNVTNVNGLAAGVITAASIATGAIDADALAADAIAEIADGVWDEAYAGHLSAGTFGLAARTADLRGERTVVRATVGAASTTTSIVTSAFSPSGAATDQFKGRIVVFDNDTTTAALRGQASDITASSNAATPTLTVTALTTAPASGDTFSVV